MRADTPLSLSESPWAIRLSRKTEVLKAALKAVSDAVAQLKGAGFDDMAAELRVSMSKIRRELNHAEAVKGHPDLFS